MQNLVAPIYSRVSWCLYARSTHSLKSRLSDHSKGFMKKQQWVGDSSPHSILSTLLIMRDDFDTEKIIGAARNKLRLFGNSVLAFLLIYSTCKSHKDPCSTGHLATSSPNRIHSARHKRHLSLCHYFLSQQIFTCFALLILMSSIVTINLNDFEKSWNISLCFSLFLY